MDSQICYFTWMAGSGRPLYLRLTLDEAESCSHSGACDPDVEALCAEEGVRTQIAAWDPETLQAELAEYGAWEETELADHEANIKRMVWIACNDVAENPEDYSE